MYIYVYVSAHVPIWTCICPYAKGVDILSSTTHVPFRWCSGGCLASADICGSKHVSLCITLPIVCHFVCFTTIALVIFHLSETHFSDFFRTFMLQTQKHYFGTFFKTVRRNPDMAFMRAPVHSQLHGSRRPWLFPNARQPGVSADSPKVQFRA